MRQRRAITDNAGYLGTIYERLRKRNYRRTYGGRPLFTPHHASYVEGLRDALNAVAAGLGNPDK